MSPSPSKGPVRRGLGRDESRRLKERHLILAGSPFAPDTVSAWWQFGASTVTAALTLGALAWSIMGTRRARKDLEDERARSALELQAEKDKAEKLEKARESAERRQGAETKAARQAVGVHIHSQWQENGPGMVQYALREPATFNIIAVKIVNDSQEDVRDILIKFDRLAGLPGGWPVSTKDRPVVFPAISSLAGGQSHVASSVSVVYVGGHVKGDDLGFSIEFTDRYLDRWRLGLDGTLTLLTPRSIDAASQWDAPTRESVSVPGALITPASLIAAAHALEHEGEAIYL